MLSSVDPLPFVWIVGRQPEIVAAVNNSVVIYRFPLLLALTRSAGTRRDSSPAREDGDLVGARDPAEEIADQRALADA